MFTEHTRTFLSQLAENNSREWFQDHKDAYEASKTEAVSFADDLLGLMHQHDNIATASGKKSVYRIYRDVRFSKDKSPYKNHWAGGMSRATAYLRGGYYWQVQPGASFLVGGFFGPNSEDLLHIRKQIEQDSSELREILAAKSFTDNFGQLDGEQLKTAPKGFAKDHPDIDLLRYKQFLLQHPVPDAVVFSADFPAYANQVFRHMRPFFNYMSDILTTDLNGNSLLDRD